MSSDSLRFVIMIRKECSGCSDSLRFVIMIRKECSGFVMEGCGGSCGTGGIS